MKYVKKFIFIFLLLFIVTGCEIKNDMSMEIKNDHSITFSITTKYDREIITNLIKIEQINNNDIEEISDNEIKEYIINNINDSYYDGFEKEYFSDSNYVGYTYKLNIDNIDKISSYDKDKIILNNLDSEDKLINQKLFYKNNEIYTANFVIKKINNTSGNDINVNTTFKINLSHPAIISNATKINNKGKELIWNFNKNENNNINFSFDFSNVEESKNTIINNKNNISICLFYISILFFSYYIILNKNNNKYKETYLLTSSLAMFLFFCLCTTNYSLNYNSNDLSANINKYADNSNIINKNENEITINATNLDEYFSLLDFYFNINKNNLYTTFVKNNKTKNLSMNNVGNNNILNMTLLNNDAKEIFENYFCINENINLKVTFNKTNTISNTLYKEINIEETIRNNIVNTALKEVGNTGEKYWKWYGYNNRVEWCAVFVSWVANQNGLIDKGIVPKFVWVKVGVDYFKNNNLFKYKKNYTPKPGDIIFFDWNNNDVIDHVGIVEKVKNNIVYTIEGNVNRESVKKRQYSIYSPYIYGYGVPEYKNYYN